MTRILSGTAAVVGGGRTVTFTGAPLSDANCPADATVVLGGASYFIDHRTDTGHFVVTRDYEGVTGTVSCEIDPLNANAISLVKITRLITDYNARLALLDADGRGLFFSSLGVTGANDPGPGKVARNNADWVLTTALYLDVIDAAGREVSGLIDLWASGTVVIVRSLATGAYASFKLGNNAINEGPDQWRRLVGLTFVESSGAIADGEDVAIDWKINGEGLHIDATGLFADRATFDNRSIPFTFVSTNGTGAESFARIYFKQSNAPGDWSAGVPFQGPKGDKGDKGDASTIPGITWQGAYNAGNAYVINDGVRFNGSSFRNILAGTGVAPSSANPPVDNASWVVVAAKGTDGAGTGNVINLGTASNLRVAVFDADGQHIKDGGKTIAELVPSGYDDLLMSVSLLAMQVADNSNVALFLGASGNRIADSFKALTYVDVAGSTNLDTSVAGLLKATPNWGGSTLVIHADGVQSSNVFTDAVAGRTVTAVGNAIVDTTQSKFGGGSALFDGSGDLIVIADNASLEPGSGNFTLDFWFRAVNVTSTSVLTGKRTGPADFGAFVLVVSGGNLSLFASTNGTSGDIANGTVVGTGLAINTWYHWALVRNGNTFKAYLNGVEAASFVNSGALFNTTEPYRIGGDVAANYFNGWIEEYRLSIGAAQWTAPFTPPTSAYSSVPNNLTVRSTALTALVAPTKAKAALRVKEVDAAVAGTDYTLEASRDGGATWSTMALAELFTSPSPVAGIRVVEAAETDVSSQPTGTAPRWRFKTLNTKNVELHDVYFYWS